jgi:hypothetical protein
MTLTAWVWAARRARSAAAFTHLGELIVELFKLTLQLMHTLLDATLLIHRGGRVGRRVVLLHDAHGEAPDGAKGGTENDGLELIVTERHVT